MKRRSSTSQEMISPIHHPRFASWYERCASTRSERRFMGPLRKEIIDQSSGLVLEIGAGTGLNFQFYQPARVERVEAVAPDATMLRYARERLSSAHVPIELTRAPAEVLPFANETLDSAVTTLVFCSVADPLRGLHEVKRVLKPGGLLLMVEHVQAQGAIAARVQDALVPLTTRFAGNCHWNRDTASTLRRAGFQIKHLRKVGGVLVPIVVVSAICP
ncbi:MAG: class I SAM-dependent methyltransferase [Ktedonobacteraceae bacterium]